MGRRRKEITVPEMIKEIQSKKEIKDKDIRVFRGVTKGSNHLTLNNINPRLSTLKSNLEAVGEELIIYVNKKYYRIK